MNNEPKDYNEDMELPMNVRDTLHPQIVQALEGRDGDGLLDAIVDSEQSPSIDAMGLRVQLRSFWLDRKDDLAKISTAGLIDVEHHVKAMFESMDSSFAQIAQDKSEMEPRQYKDILVHQLAQLEPDSRVAFIEGMADVDVATLDSRETLLPWVFEWRNRIVEDTWKVVQDFRELGDTAQTREKFSQVMMSVNSDLDQLVRGTTRPGEVEE